MSGNKFGASVLFALGASLIGQSAWSLGDDFKKTMADRWANASKVCEIPSLSVGHAKKYETNEHTGWYYIGHIPSSDHYLSVKEVGGRLVPLYLPAAESPRRKWLSTSIGAEFASHATCYEGKALCMTLDLNDQKSIVMEPCVNQKDYYSQGWWRLGFYNADHQLGIGLGSEALGKRKHVSGFPLGQPLHLVDSDNGLVPKKSLWFYYPVEETDGAEKTPEDSQVEQGVDTSVDTNSNNTRLAFDNNAQIDEYVCESGRIVQAQYMKEDVLLLRYADLMQQLHSQASGSGSKYGGKDKAWGWWSKGERGSIFEYNADGSEGDFIDSCNKPNPEIDYAVDEVFGDGDDRRWTAEGAGNDAVLRDCKFCGEDVGLSLSCNADKGTVMVTSFWSGLPKKPESSDSKIQFTIGDERFNYTAQVTEMAMVGFVPEFTIAENDPLLDALQYSEAAKLSASFGGESVDYHVQGLRSAMASFRLLCGR